MFKASSFDYLPKKPLFRHSIWGNPESKVGDSRVVYSNLVCLLSLTTTAQSEANHLTS